MRRPLLLLYLRSTLLKYIRRMFLITRLSSLHMKILRRFARRHLITTRRMTFIISLSVTVPQRRGMKVNIFEPSLRIHLPLRVRKTMRSLIRWMGVILRFRVIRNVRKRNPCVRNLEERIVSLPLTQSTPIILRTRRLLTVNRWRSLSILIRTTRRNLQKNMELINRLVAGTQ